jgi:hypothetical protein
MNARSRIYSYLGFEHRHKPLLPQRLFMRRMALIVVLSLGILTGWTFLGMLGYHLLAQLPWVDSFLNASMIVGGMGPVDMLKAPGAKLFAGLYAILSGVLFLSVFGLLFAPVFHRFLHRFHLEADDQTKPEHGNF